MQLLLSVPQFFIELSNHVLRPRLGSARPPTVVQLHFIDRCRRGLDFEFRSMERNIFRRDPDRGRPLAITSVQF